MIMNFVFLILVVTASIFLFGCIVALINWIAEKYSDINQAITQSENWEHSKSDIYNRIEKLEREGKEMTVEQLQSMLTKKIALLNLETIEQSLIGEICQKKRNPNG